MPDPNITIPATLDGAWLASVITGAFLPWLIAKIQSSQASEQFRAWFSFLACLLAGAVVTYLTRSWSGTWGADVSANIYVVVFNVGTLLLAAWQSYARLWTHTSAFQKVNNDPNGLGRQEP